MECQGICHLVVWMNLDGKRNHSLDRLLDEESHLIPKLRDHQGGLAVSQQFLSYFKEVEKPVPSSVQSIKKYFDCLHFTFLPPQTKPNKPLEPTSTWSSNSDFSNHTKTTTITRHSLGLIWGLRFCGFQMYWISFSHKSSKFSWLNDQFQFHFCIL